MDDTTPPHPHIAPPPRQASPINHHSALYNQVELGCHLPLLPQSPAASTLPFSNDPNVIRPPIYGINGLPMATNPKLLPGELDFKLYFVRSN
jgi:hypothetical protein